MSFTLEDITIRTKLQPGDLGYIIHRHGKLYAKEYGYGIVFESYVAAGIHEFYQSMIPSGTAYGFVNITKTLSVFFSSCTVPRALPNSGSSTWNLPIAVLVSEKN